MRDSLINRIVKHKLVKNCQHGFVKNRSALKNLLVFMEEVRNYLDLGYPVEVIYPDFQKAFDKVRHGRLLLKLEARGISGNVLRWFGARIR